MYPAQFEYHKAGSVKEALDLLAKHKDDAKVLAGGHSLLPAMKLRLAQPKHVIDIGKISSLSGVKEEGGTLVIGALTTHYAIESSAVLKSKCPLMPEVAGHIGDPMVRNMGTLGGSLAHADPAADWPAAVIALGAEMVAEGPKGKRTIKIDDFFKGLLTTALADDEILTEIRVPAAAASVKSAYAKFPHPASRFAVVGVAAVLTMDGGKIGKARLCFEYVLERATQDDLRKQAQVQLDRIMGLMALLVSEPCKRGVEGRYPLAAVAQDASVDDFTQVFAV